MDDSIKILTTKFNLSNNLLDKVAKTSKETEAWLIVLGAYVLDHDKREEDQKQNEANLRKQRLNAEHQLSQLEKQLISCNTKLNANSKELLISRTKMEELEVSNNELQEKLKKAVDENKNLKHDNETEDQRYRLLDNEKLELLEQVEKKNREVERLNEEWKSMSEKLSASEKVKYELQYKFDEIKNHEITREFKEKRLEQEKNMLSQQVKQLTNDLKAKSANLSSTQRNTTNELQNLRIKFEEKDVENIHLSKSVETFKKTCEEQERKLELLAAKLKRGVEEHLESERTLQVELNAQNKLVDLYREDRDEIKNKMGETSTAIEELQNLLRKSKEDNNGLTSQIQALKEEHNKSITEMKDKVHLHEIELKNANELLQISNKKGNQTVSQGAIEALSPMAAATSAILKKGMTLTQIYTEYMKVSDMLQTEKDENARLKVYLEQILQEVEEKAPVLQQQKEDYIHAIKTVENMSGRLEENITECHRLRNECSDYQRKVDFHKREEKRLHTLCVDLSRQVRVLMKEVEEARGGVVSSSDSLPELLPEEKENKVSSSAQVISDHLVTFKSIEELQGQNQRLLAVVRELSEEQEKLEKEGGTEVIQELRNKIEQTKEDMELMKESHKKQEEMMEQLSRQRDMYKVLCQTGGGATMVGDISSSTASAAAHGQSILEFETELSKTKLMFDNSMAENENLKKSFAEKEQNSKKKISSLEEELASARLEKNKFKNQLEFSEEKHSIVVATSEGFKKEAKALEMKCKSITDALSKLQVEAEKYKTDYTSVREKLLTAEVSVKALETEKHLIKEGEKRLMQENQSLLDQQRSQNVLLTNLQTIQNNLERELFESRKTLGSQVDKISQELKANRKKHDKDEVQMKHNNASLTGELRITKDSYSKELEQHKKTKEDLETAQKSVSELDAKVKELSEQLKATESRLENVLEREASGKEKEDYQHEVERYKEKIRTLEIAIGKAQADAKSACDSSDAGKKHVQQYKEIAAANDQALKDLTKANEDLKKAKEKELKGKQTEITDLKTRLSNVVNEKNTLKRNYMDTERQLQSTISDLKTQMAPMDRKYQEVQKALVQAKELETNAVRTSQEQSDIAKESQEKYERELVLHAKDVEQLTLAKDELKVYTQRVNGLEDRLKEITAKLTSNEQLMEQMRNHHSQEVRKGEVARKDLIDQNAILHSQVEKLSKELADAKALKVSQVPEVSTSTEKSIEEVYELLRFVRREKEIAETKCEASESESMRYRQRAEHLQRDIDETKAALELELQRTQGRMLTELEYKDMMEKVKKCKEYEGLNRDLERQKVALVTQARNQNDKLRKFEAQIKPLEEAKKNLESDKSSWLAEKTALKAEIERWTNRTNQLMAQSAKSDNEDIKKLTALKVQNEKAIQALRDEIQRTKSQLDSLRRESLKLKNENNDLLTKEASLTLELEAAKREVVSEKEKVVASEKSAAQVSSSTNDETKKQLDDITKQLEETKKTLMAKNKLVTDKTKMVLQLKKLGKKYKLQSETLEKILKENNIEYEEKLKEQNITPASASAEFDNAEKKEIQDKLDQALKRVEELSKEIETLKSQLEESSKKSSEKETELQETKARYVESEKKGFSLKKELESIQKEREEEAKVTQERNKKLLKSAKEKINTLQKAKDAGTREMETLKSQLEESNKKNTELQQSLSETSTDMTSAKSQLEHKMTATEQHMKLLIEEKKTLTEKVEALTTDNQRLQLEKRRAEKFIKTASQQKVRIQAVSIKDKQEAVTVDTSMLGAPLTATVRPTSTPSAQGFSKHHQQAAPTASIRPLTHGAPTAMVSPTVPLNLPSTATPVASVTAQPPQNATSTSEGIQRRSTRRRSSSGDKSATRSFKPTPLQAATATTEGTSEMDQAREIYTEEPGPSRVQTHEEAPIGGKRSHTHVEDDDDSIDIAHELQDAPGGKRARTQQQIQQADQFADVEPEAQDNLSEDALLAEEVDDDAFEDAGTEDNANQPSQQSTSQSSMQQSSQEGLRLSQLHMRRQSQPSPQELLRQRPLRSRSQLPSFSLVPGQNNAQAFDDADDCRVPSTPTLFIPKQTDGFAEAVSSPQIRHPMFSFAPGSESQTSQGFMSQQDQMSRAEGSRGDMMGIDDAGNAPLTPMSIVPSVSSVPKEESSEDSEGSKNQDMPHHQETKIDKHVSFAAHSAFEESNQEQNVPQQVDLTSDDGDSRKHSDMGTDDADFVVDKDLEADIGGVDDDDDEPDSDSDESEDSSDDSEEEDDDDQDDDDDEENILETGTQFVMEGNLDDQNYQDSDIIEIDPDEDEEDGDNLFDQEEQISMGEQRPSSTDIIQEERTSIESPQSTSASQPTDADTNIPEPDKSKPVRLMRQTARGSKRLLLRRPKSANSKSAPK